MNVIDTVQQDMLRYPIGKFSAPATLVPEQIQQYIQDISELPGLIRRAVQSLSDEQLDTPYRPGGWTVRQTVHHVADSHMNAYIRFKLALTENNPTIKPYEEHLWAELPDGKDEPVEVSLLLLEALHHRWVILLKSLSEADWQRTYMHPESGKNRLANVAGMYAWHGKHHVAHITNLRETQGW